MHYRGKSVRFKVAYPDGTEELVLSVTDFDFNWQRSYRFERPLVLPAGSTMVVTGVFDNSKENVVNPNPNKRVFWGPQSSNEMFIAFLQYERLS